jgi:hypothetical protein
LNELIYGGQQLVVKTAALEEAIDEWSPANLRRAQSSHSGTIFFPERPVAQALGADAAVLRNKPFCGKHAGREESFCVRTPSHNPVLEESP